MCVKERSDKADGSDEQGCDSVKSCQDWQFRCNNHPGSVAMKTYTTLLQPEAHPSYSCFLPALLPPFTHHSRNH